MGAQRRNALGSLVFVVGTACVSLVLLLWWTSVHGPGVGASSGSGQHSRVMIGGAYAYSDVSSVWTSTEPVTIEITDPEWHNQIVWPISQYGVTITFPPAAVQGEAVFTFTPSLSEELPSVLATSYFFEIEGTWVIDPRPVSLAKPVHMALAYDPMQLGMVMEGTLRAYLYEPALLRWIPVQERSGEFYVDAEDKVFHMDFLYLRPFGIGGYRSQSYMPLVTHFSEVVVSVPGGEAAE